jgi:hypothetical protein
MTIPVLCNFTSGRPSRWAPDAPVELEPQEGMVEFSNAEAALMTKHLEGPIARPSDHAKPASGGGGVQEPKVGRGFTVSSG